jgi:DNA uptake protein ComE-like DNA-binding protein
MRMEHRVRSRSVSVSDRPAGADSGRPAATKGIPSHRDRLDVNTASTGQLMSLNGIGRFYAGKIVDGRPYHGVDELSIREILPHHIFARIRDRLEATRR